MKNGIKKNYRFGRILLLFSIFACGIIIAMKNPVGISGAEKMELNETTVKLETGQDFTLDCWDPYIFKGDLRFSSKDPSIAYVSSSGKIIAINPGKTTITVTGTDSKGIEKKGTCKVEVKASATTLSVTEISAYAGTEHYVSYFNPDITSDYYVSMNCFDEKDWRLVSTFYMDAYRTFYCQPNEMILKCKEKGNYTVVISLRGKDWNYHGAICRVSVEQSGLPEYSYIGIQGQEWTPEIVNAYELKWTNPNPEVVSIDENGTFHFLSYGTSVISVEFYNPDWQKIKRDFVVDVSNPKLVNNSGYLKVGYYKPEFEGTFSFSRITLKSSNPKIVKVSDSAYGYYEVLKAGKCTLTMTVDGKKITKKVEVIDPSVPESVVVLKGKKVNIGVKGTGSAKVTYTSSNKKVATVSSKGVITGKAKGRAKITIQCGQYTYTCGVQVGTTKGVTAAQKAASVAGAKYSQEKRNQKGYYDCSSLVWRSYAAAGVKLGGFSASPTAAELAKKLEKEGKVIYYGYVAADKLQPGDVIFYGYANNGRYKGIYHTSIFYGPAYYDSDPNYNHGVVMEAGDPVGMYDYSAPKCENIVMICRPFK